MQNGLRGLRSADCALHLQTGREACLHRNLHRSAALLPANRRWLEKVDVKTVERDRVDMLGQGTEQAGSLAFATGVESRAFFFLADKDGVIAKALSTILVGDGHVVD